MGLYWQGLKNKANQCSLIQGIQAHNISFSPLWSIDVQLEALFLLTTWVLVTARSG